jgi:hypothetical protein
MMPGIWCKGHDLEGRSIYDMNDVDPEQNEVSTTSTVSTLSSTNADLQTALQIYTASYKGIPQDESFALLRKATRLDRHILQPKHFNHARKCETCDIDVSPRWHKIEDANRNTASCPMDMDKASQTVFKVKQEHWVNNAGSEKHLCHQCWFQS